MLNDHSDREREETCCHIMGYSFRLTARVVLYAPSPQTGERIPRPLLHPVVAHWLEREIDRCVHHGWTLNLESRLCYNALASALQLDVTKAVVCAILSVGWCI